MRWHVITETVLGVDDACVLFQKGQELQYLDGSDWVTATVRACAPDPDGVSCNHSTDMPVAQQQMCRCKR